MLNNWYKVRTVTAEQVYPVDQRIAPDDLELPSVVSVQRTRDLFALAEFIVRFRRPSVFGIDKVPTSSCPVLESKNTTKVSHMAWRKEDQKEKEGRKEETKRERERETEREKQTGEKMTS